MCFQNRPTKQNYPRTGLQSKIITGPSIHLYLDCARCRPQGVVYSVIQRAWKGSHRVHWSAVPPN